MCGIVGYTGKKKAAPILLDGLAKLEYRGYDSAGLSVRDGDKNPIVVKAKGRLKVLSEKTDGGAALKGTCGIGHTRWATHGEPTENNAHPHIVDDYNVVGVHNGIIENYQELRDKMIRKGYKFYSETDTEVAIKTIDYYYKKYTHDPIEALAKTMVRVRGSYALAVMFKDHPGKIFVARKDSPMIIGYDKDASYLASDVPAILKYTRTVYYIDDLEMACLEAGNVTFYNLDGDTIEKTPPHNLKLLHVLIIQFQNTKLLLHRVLMKRPTQLDNHRFCHERAARCPPPFFAAWAEQVYLHEHVKPGLYALHDGRPVARGRRAEERDLRTLCGDGLRQRRVGPYAELLPGLRPALGGAVHADNLRRRRHRLHEADASPPHRTKPYDNCFHGVSPFVPIPVACSKKRLTRGFHTLYWCQRLMRPGYSHCIIHSHTA